MTSRGMTMVGVVLAGGLVGGCSSGPRAPMPAASASADDVVAAYTTALEMGDCATATALVHPQAGDPPECEDTLHVTSRQPSIVDPGPWPTWPTGSQVRRVFVQRQVTMSLYGGLQHRTEQGEWAYWVVRTTPHDPWRILGEGLG